jgi:hypothetical protein
LLEALRGLTNAERPFDARKMTVLRLAFDLKWRPRMVSVPPTWTRIGETLVIAGVGDDFFAIAVGAPMGTATAASASTQVVRFLRDIMFPLSAGLAVV